MGAEGRRAGRRINAVIFDFGNVLSVLDRPAVELSFATHSALPPKEIGARIWDGAILLDAETGRIDSREHHARIRDAIGADPAWSYETFEREYMGCLLPHPPGKEALVAASKAGLRTFILSNTSYLHSRAIFLDETLATVPELHALSYKVGFMKPDPRIWLWLLDRAGLRAQECVYIDDIEAYCATAAGLGMTAIAYDYRKDDILQKLRAAL